MRRVTKERKDGRKGWEGGKLMRRGRKEENTERESGRERREIKRGIERK